MNLHTLGTVAAIAGALALAMPAAAQAATTHYVAHLHAMNADAAHAKTSGEAKFTVKGDTLKIDIRVHGAPAGIEHWQHFHGFADGQAASCATSADDANKDGIIDVTETAKASGTTMVPFTSDPVAMDVPHGTYPKADAKGDYHYTAKVSLKALDAAFTKAFPGQKLDLTKRVVYIHGVPESAKLPASVASLGPIPANVTLPIACGKIEAARK